MKAHYTVTLPSRSGRITFEIEGGTTKELFRTVAEVESVFVADGACGACGSARIQYRVRTWDGNDYYELACEGCSAKLAFGQHKQGGGLYPRRLDKDGKEIGKRGWKVWRPRSADGGQAEPDEFA